MINIGIAMGWGISGDGFEVAIRQRCDAQQGYCHSTIPGSRLKFTNYILCREYIHRDIFIVHDWHRFFLESYGRGK